MQVKKFEAKTMKEALELVKVHLGPEAIILSAKDTHRGFGLMGEKSVEVTAAVSEETLRRKKIAEAKLREDLRQRFQQIPAARQKQFINKVFKEAVKEPAVETISAEMRAQTKGMRYIDIGDDEVAPVRGNAVPTKRPAEYGRGATTAAVQPRIRNAVERTDAPAVPARSARVSAAAAAAASAALATFEAPPAQNSVKAAVAAQAPQARSNEVRALESQVRELKAIVERFQAVPQIPMSMHPGAEQGLSYELSGIYQRLTTQGVQPQIVTALLRKAQKEIDTETLKKPALVDAWVVRRLLDTVEVTAQPTASRYHVFVGSTGQGKTTTLVKFASHLMLKEKRTIAIISLDTMKLGAADQLRLYAQILNVPFAIVRTPEEWRVAEQKLAHVNHILVDCPGLSLRHAEEREWLQRMLPPSASKSTHFVQSILARDEETLEIASRYQSIGFNDVIFTRLDESGRQGMILNFQDRFKVPLHSFAFGTRIPEDFEFASKERVVDFLFKLSKVTRREEPA
ncbi:MAG: flagellar biosynthesis protein FlhF [Bdellovibrionales bacterium]|nr:flagellar biosynthesis protein FlhF [Bdellovibrionales bacterium]